MEQLANHFKNLVYFITLNPGSVEELYVRLFLGLIAGAAILNLMAQKFRMTLPTFKASMLVILISGLTLFMMSYFGHRYFIKIDVFSGVDKSEFTLGLFVVFSMLLVVPLIKSTWCGNMFNATVSWGVTVAVFMLTCVAIGEIFQMSDTGKEFASRKVTNQPLSMQKALKRSANSMFSDR